MRTRVHLFSGASPRVSPPAHQMSFHMPQSHCSSCGSSLIQTHRVPPSVGAVLLNEAWEDRTAWGRSLVLVSHRVKTSWCRLSRRSRLINYVVYVDAATVKDGAKWGGGFSAQRTHAAEWRALKCNTKCQTHTHSLWEQLNICWGCRRSRLIWLLCDARLTDANSDSVRAT